MSRLSQRWLALFKSCWLERSQSTTIQLKLGVEENTVGFCPSSDFFMIGKGLHGSSEQSKFSPICCEWVNISSGTSSLRLSRTKSIKP